MRQTLIDYAKAHLCDVIPYNAEDYEEQLQKIAEVYADEELERMKNYKLIDKSLLDNNLPF